MALTRVSDTTNDADPLKSQTDMACLLAWRTDAVRLAYRGFWLQLLSGMTEPPKETPATLRE